MMQVRSFMRELGCLVVLLGVIAALFFLFAALDELWQMVR